MTGEEGRSSSGGSRLAGPLLLAGVGAFAAGLLADWSLSRPFSIGLVQGVLIVAGAVLVLAAFRRSAAGPAARQSLFKGALALIAGLAMLGLLETGFRVAGHDFSHRRRAFDSIPIYFRQPVVPVGDVFFRRPGPATWRGKVLAIGHGHTVGLAEAYAAEAPVEIAYDADGFRNPSDLADWDVAVIGDSFVELGQLPYEQLFTSRLAALTGLRVRNLGVSQTGTLCHTVYLREFGKSASTRHAVIVFFEGNDLRDLLDEEAQLAEFRETGRRPLREVDARESRQTSLVEALRGLLRPTPSERVRTDAAFASAEGEVPVTLVYTPPNESEIPAASRERLESALDGFVAAANELGVRPWILFMPAKRRVLHGRLRFEPTAKPDLVAWKPSDFASYLARVCEERGIGFVDPTPLLLADTERGVLTYNHLYDTHLNAAGCDAVGRALADALHGE